MSHGIRKSWDEILSVLFKERYTGQVVIHLRGGVPQIVEYGRPNRYEIVPDLPAGKNPLTPGNDSV